MIAFRGVATRRGPLAAAVIDRDWSPGVHALLGVIPDGARIVLSLASGALKPRRGTVQVLDGSPADALVRKQIAHVGADVVLPERLRVDEVLSVAATLRGDPVSDAASRLAAWGLERLARRAVASLSRAESRAIATAEAFTSTRVRVVLLEEPFAGLDADASARLAVAMGVKAREGGTVLFSTGSLRDASAFADDVDVVGRTGSVQHLAPGTAPLGLRGPAFGGSSPHAGASHEEAPRVRLALVTANANDAESVAGHLLHDPDVAGMAYGAASPAQAVVLRIEGRDVVALANAAARAAVASRVNLLQLHVETGNPEENP